MNDGSGSWQTRAAGARARKGDNAASAAPLKFRAYEDIAETMHKHWLVRDMLGAEEISVFFGPPGSGKSVLTEDLHLHVGGNMTWHERATDSGLSILFALERAKLVERRALAFRRKTGLTTLPFAIVPGPINFMDVATAGMVLDVVHRIEDKFGIGTTLLGIDTVSAALCGGDENSPKDMGALVATFRRIQEKLSDKAHMLATHHQPHDAKRMRGHGVLLGAVDATIEVDGSNALARSATVRKTNDGEEGLKVTFKLESVVIGENENGVTTAPVVVPVIGVSAKANAAAKTTLPATARIALDTLTDLIVDFGQTPPSNARTPDNAKAVKIQQWREDCYRRGISKSEEPRARQLAFDRAATALQAAKVIGVWEPFVWLARP